MMVAVTAVSVFPMPAMDTIAISFMVPVGTDPAISATPWSSPLTAPPGPITTIPVIETRSPDVVRARSNSIRCFYERGRRTDCNTGVVALHAAPGKQDRASKSRCQRHASQLSQQTPPSKWIEIERNALRLSWQVRKSIDPVSQCGHLLKNLFPLTLCRIKRARHFSLMFTHVL